MDDVMIQLVGQGGVNTVVSAASGWVPPWTADDDVRDMAVPVVGPAAWD